MKIWWSMSGLVICVDLWLMEWSKYGPVIDYSMFNVLWSVHMLCTEETHTYTGVLQKRIIYILMYGWSGFVVTTISFCNEHSMDWYSDEWFCINMTYYGLV